KAVVSPNLNGLNNGKGNFEPDFCSGCAAPGCSGTGAEGTSVLGKGAGVGSGTFCAVAPETAITPDKIAPRIAAWAFAMSLSGPPWPLAIRVLWLFRGA